MLPSSVELAENIKRTVRSLAQEIGKRCEADRHLVDGQLNPNAMQDFVKHHAEAVLLDWFLGDFIPERASPTTPDITDANNVQTPGTETET